MGSRSETSPKDLRQTLEWDGYVIIRSAIYEPKLTTLRTACHEIVALARAGQWPHVRTLPKQFPPWSSDVSNGIWVFNICFIRQCLDRAFLRKVTSGTLS
jgi:hypothetical protein